MNKGSRKIHVAFFCLNAYSLFNPGSSAQIGGTEVQMYLLAKELSKFKELKLSFIVGNFKQKKKETFSKITTFRSITTQKSLIQYLIAPFIILVSLIRTNADVYIASPAGPEIGIIALFAKITGKKFIFRTASSVDCTFEKKDTLGPISGLLYLLGIKFSSAVVTQTKNDSENMRKYYSRTSKQIANGICTQLINPGVNTREKIVWIGSARKVKQPEIFLRMAKQLPEYEFQMILSHSGKEDIWHQIEKAAQNIKNLSFVGEVQFEDIKEYLDTAKILVGTSVYEGFPNTYLQAAYSGIPIVSLNVDPDHMIINGNFGYVVDGSEERLKKAIQEIIEDQKTYEIFSKNAMEFTKSNYDMKIVSQKWYNVLRNLFPSIKYTKNIDT